MSFLVNKHHCGCLMCDFCPQLSSKLVFHCWEGHHILRLFLHPVAIESVEHVAWGGRDAVSAS